MQPKKRPKIEPPDDQQQRLSDAEVSDETDNVDTPSLGSEQQLQRLEQEDERSRRLAELRAKRSNELSAEEKHEKMRLTNRESAKKLRRKRTEQMHSLQAEVAALRAENASLQQRLRQAADSNMALVSVVRSMRSGGSGALDGSAAGSTSAASAPSVDTHALGSLLGVATGLTAQSSGTQGPSSSLEALLQGMGSGSIAAGPTQPAQPPQPPTSPLAGMQGMPGGLAAAAAAALAAQQMMRQSMPAPVWPFQPPSQNRPPLPPALNIALAAATNGPPSPLSALWPLMQQQGPSAPWPGLASLLQLQQQPQTQAQGPHQEQQDQQVDNQRHAQQLQADAAGSLPSPASGAAGAASAAQFASWLQALGSGVRPPMGPDSSPVVLPPPLGLNLWPQEMHVSMPDAMLSPAAHSQPMAGPAAAPAGLSSLPSLLQTLLAAGLPVGAAAAAAAAAAASGAQGSDSAAHLAQVLGDAASVAQGSVEQQMALARARSQQRQGQMAAHQFSTAPAHTQASSAAHPLAPAASQLQRAGTMMSCTAEVCEPLPIRTEQQE